VAEALTGGCLCGGVRFELTEPPVSASYCHCTRCQKRTGTAASPQARIVPGSIHVTGEELVRAYEPPDGFPKAFCSACGSALWSINPDTGQIRIHPHEPSSTTTRASGPRTGSSPPTPPSGSRSRTTVSRATRSDLRLSPANLVAMSRRRLAIFASLAGLSALVVAMVAVRVVYTGNDYFTNLVWNLFLAWIPFGLAVYAYDGYRKGIGRAQLWAAGGLWLLFFPNALYIVTDFKWLNEWAGAPIWYDIVLVLSAAWCGLLLGFTTLYLIQGVVRDAFGAASRVGVRIRHPRAGRVRRLPHASSAGTPGTSSPSAA
jgi:hypothetical protein